MTHPNNNGTDLNREFSLRMTEHQKEVLKERCEMENMNMSEYLRYLINEECDPRQSLERIEEEITELERGLEEKKKERRKIKMTLQEEKSELREYEAEVVSFLEEVYTPDAHGIMNKEEMITAGVIDMIIVQLNKSEGKFPDLYVREEEELRGIIWDVHESEEYNEPREFAERAFNLYIEEGVLGVIHH